jgi:alkyl sulfatase BDS1-like metallo-beta-lactamase superfamily hydrolase
LTDGHGLIVQAGSFVAAGDGVRAGQGEEPVHGQSFDFLAGDAVAPATVNPSLWRDAQIMYVNTGLFKVTDGIYQVCGMDISNVTFIEGDNGVTVMDPLMSEEVAKAALDLYYEHRPKKPVVAVIITHSHIDHYGGVLGITTTADLEAGTVSLYAPTGFTSAALNESVVGGNREARMSGYQYSMLVERGPKGNMTSGLGLDTSKGNTTFAIPTTLITETGQKETIDGLEYEFMLAPDTEAPAEMLFYIPKYKALTVAEDATFTMHNVYSLRGTTVRSSYNWAMYLREAREKWGGVDLLDGKRIVRPRESLEWTRRLTDLGIFSGISAANWSVSSYPGSVRM